MLKTIRYLEYFSLFIDFCRLIFLLNNNNSNNTHTHTHTHTCIYIYIYIYILYIYIYIYIYIKTHVRECESIRPSTELLDVF